MLRRPTGENRASKLDRFNFNRGELRLFRPDLLRLCPFFPHCWLEYYRLLLRHGRAVVVNVSHPDQQTGKFALHSRGQRVVFDSTTELVGLDPLRSHFNFIDNSFRHEGIDPVSQGNFHAGIALPLFQVRPGPNPDKKLTMLVIVLFDLTKEETRP